MPIAPPCPGGIIKGMNTTLALVLSKLVVTLGILQIALAAVPSAQYQISPPPRTFPNQASIRDYIVQEADYAGVPVSEALWIAEHESAFQPYRVGDRDFVCPKTGKIAPSYGLYQISTCYHPEVPTSTSLSVIGATAWAMGQMRDDPNQFSSWAWHVRTRLE